MSDDLDAIMARAVNVHRVLSQDRVWVDQTGKRVEVKDIDPRYARNIVRFLERRAADLALGYGLGQTTIEGPQGDMASLEYERELEAEWKEQTENPVAWLHTTRLVRELVSKSAVAP